ncbi:MAG: cobalamin biosynthesis protein CobD [Tepidiforma sp.]|nr:MAG: cobalamin biosynthesis protein CobD [Tepidiforma sp.]
MVTRRLAVLAAALALDAAAGELPNGWHPVAWMGRLTGLLDRVLTRSGSRDTVRAGFVLTGIAAGGAALAGWRLEQWTRRAGVAGVLVEAAALKQALAVRGLMEHAEAVRRPLAAGDVEGARAAAGRMVSRATAGLPPDLVASAAIESVAENLSDGVTGTALWYVAAGLPGAFAYRAVNTLDAMVGYHARGRFGMVPARLDDAANLVPARLTALLIVLACPRALRRLPLVVRDAGGTPSPNSGWPMAAMAHGLGVRLEKRGHHVLHAGGRAPGAEDIRRACRAGVLAVGLGGLLAAAAAGWRSA